MNKVRGNRSAAASTAATATTAAETTTPATPATTVAAAKAAATVTTAAATPSATATATASTAAFAMERIRPDKAERGLHRIGLSGPALPLLVIHRFRCAAASAEPTASGAKVTSASGAARILHKAFVEGLFKRIRN